MRLLLCQDAPYANSPLVSCDATTESEAPSSFKTEKPACIPLFKKQINNTIKKKQQQGAQLK
eukprot:m.30047 g.30047  ORF g.30047 m.30047 type:complete len:62 (-) comp9609_c0_seq10:1108-1293(-)